MKVSVVICAYTLERWDQLCEAMRSLTNQTRLPDEIVIVSDCNDELLEKVRATFREAVVVPNGGKRGLSDARNTGVSVSTGDLVIFLDDDAAADPQLIQVLVEALANDDVVAAGGRARPVWEAGRPKWFPPEFDWVVGCSYVGMPTERAPIRNLIGCNMGFRREVFEAVGGFRSDMGRIGAVPLGCEETELCLRIGAVFGAESIVYVPDAVVDHLVTAPRSRFGYFIKRCFSEGLSKAIVTTLHPARVALTTEMDYTTRVLPRGFKRYATSTFSHRQNEGLACAGAIIVGLTVTGFGYLIGRLRALMSRSGIAATPMAVSTGRTNGL